MLEKIAEAVQYIQNKKSSCPKIGIVLGSGLGDYTQNIQKGLAIPYSEIPHFLPTTVEGHPGRLILGEISGIEIALFQGRVHAYEGIAMNQVVFPVRVMASLGVEVLILTNAAGGINPSFNQGDLVLIEDHINLMGNNPLVGANCIELGPRFPDMTCAYPLPLREIMKKCAEECGYSLQSGVYCSLLGPTYETPAEIRMLRTLGADMVGMSTVPESIAANHLGLNVIGLSCITNLAAGLSKEKLSHTDISIQAEKIMNLFSEIMNKAIVAISQRT